MGTRSLTYVKEKYKTEEGKIKEVSICCMYRQYDGYPSGHGLELAEFLNSGKLVNGIGMDEKERVFNGTGCLAAQMVAHFKKGAGGIYLHQPIKQDAGQEYEYDIIFDWDTKEIELICREVGYMNKGKYVDKKRILFKGSPDKFNAFVEVEESKV